MSRVIPEWIGKTDDAMPPRTVFDRLWAKQDGKDAVTGIAFGAKDKVVRDHIVPLIDGGANAESNLQLITEGTHKLKTAMEAGQRGKERSVRQKARGYVIGEKFKWPSRPMGGRETQRARRERERTEREQ